MPKRRATWLGQPLTWTISAASLIWAYRVTVAGSISLDDIPAFAGIPVSIFIAGRAIRNASHPQQAAAAFQAAISRAFPARDE